MDKKKKDSGDWQHFSCCFCCVCLLCLQNSPALFWLPSRHRLPHTEGWQ